MSDAVARVLSGRYRFVERLGRGGMGTVWRARDDLLGRDVAVKEILLPHGLDEAELAAARGRSLREARAAAQVRHPAVVTIHDVVIEDGHPWIVMQLVRAPSLEERLRASGPLAVAEAARVGAALAGALAAVHAHGIVHRDLKPANVLLADDGEVVLTDFGIAVIEGDARFTRSGLLIGTPGFMAPERLAGEHAGPASDLWSLGAVLYAAVEGRRAFEGSAPAVVDAAVLAGTPAPQHRSGPLEPLITALLSRAPGDRPDASSAAARLTAIASAVGDAAEPLPQPSGERAEVPATVKATVTVPAGTEGTGDAAARQAGAVPAWLRDPDHASPRDAPPSAPKWLPGIALAVVLVTGGLIAWGISAADGRAKAVRPVADPCSLLTGPQLSSLGLAPRGAESTSDPEPTPTERGASPNVVCEWNRSGSASAGTPSSGTAPLTLDLTTYTDVPAASAGYNLRHFSPTITTDFFESARIGDESSAAADGRTTPSTITVVFRVGRTVVSVVTRDFADRDTALRAAGWAGAALARAAR
ncbi:serine/threonine-protein kinase [Actinomadura montaniterrae]|uniref:non-specific serine/threonine protein kinase n=1 Tax=Actinomadura montaniterrae TaxID=1803903 RepID=A0A6L3VFR6_9ACTN|nr:serine/threonine-protein kinase [Actinomadura montaniterrae]KAB2365594.1 protein kinase [Actinomadura montaniterrae]